MEEEKRWLTLSEASKLLGVHPATLRQWADAGDVPSFRTPGGHRRFEASELRHFLLQASAAEPDLEGLPAAALIETALVQTRSELRRSPPDENAWFAAFDESGRERQRALGRQLFEDAVQFIIRPDQRQDLLERGRQLGEAYAQSSLTYDISLIETVRGFQYFRRSLLQALTSSDASARLTDAEDLRLRQETDTYLDEVLFGLIGAYEHALLGPAPQAQALNPPEED